MTPSGSPKVAEAAAKTKPRKPSKCSACGLVGHRKNSLDCPCKHQNLTPTDVPNPPRGNQVLASVATIIKVIYIIYDIETTGFSKILNEIIELYAIGLDNKGDELAGTGPFYSLVKPRQGVSDSVAIHGITDAKLRNESDFKTVGNAFMTWIKKNIGNDPCTKVCLVAYNGKSFDNPFLLEQCQIHRVEICPNITFQIDPYLWVKHQDYPYGIIRPHNFKLATMYKYITGKDLDGAHQAMADVEALVNIFKHPPIWSKRKTLLTRLEWSKESPVSQEEALTVVAEDETCWAPEEALAESAGSFMEADERYQLAEPDPTDKDDEEGIPQQTLPPKEGWITSTTFEGVDSPTKFEEKRRTIIQSPPATRTKDQDEPSIPFGRKGIQHAPGSLNSVPKAFNSVFTQRIMSNVVKRTNEYGSALKGADWKDVTRDDLMDTLSVLWIASCQRRRDGPSAWFSEDPLINCPPIRRIMTGRKFARIMRGLHIAPVDADPADPNQKLQEFSGALLERFRDLYEPEQQLSLDESLIRAFGRIGFKVRVVTKAARYGIKLYVLTESTSGYVLNVEMYTGGAGHIQSEELKKTTQVVKRLCKPYNGSYRTVYVDRFYTSIEVIKELHESDLFVTGTVMANRIPKHLRWTNKYARDKPRGYHECHVYTFEDSKGQTIVIGLTIWKDRKPVIVLTSDGDCRPTGSCKRRSKAERGIIDLNRPEIVRRYNEYMGGVDFADQRRLHAETRLHGLRRWWIRIFFYYVDVGIENAGILYCAAKKIPRKEWPNLLELKKQLVYHFMGSRIFAVEHGLRPADENSILPAHHIEKRYAQKKGRDSRRKCTLCLANGKYSKAGSVCAGCELGNGCCLPFCVEVDRNCWRLFHQMPLAQRERVVEIYEAGQASFLGRLGPPATKKRRK